MWRAIERSKNVRVQIQKVGCACAMILARLKKTNMETGHGYMDFEFGIFFETDRLIYIRPLYE